MFNYFYNEMTRKYIIAFGNMFNGIKIKRKDANGGEIDNMKVPIIYGPKEKFLVRLKQDKNLDRKPAIKLPMISFEINSFTYDTTRAIAKTGRQLRTANNVTRAVYNPAPYDINITLSVSAKRSEDAIQVIEQIIPFFRPDFTPSIKVLDDPEIIKDIPIILEGVTPTDTYEGDFEERRAIIWDLEFRIKAEYYGDPSDVGLIDTSVVNFYIDDFDSDVGSSNTEVETITSNSSGDYIESD